MPLYGRSPWKPTFSFCFNCGSTLAWHDNLPLVSYLRLMGRCRRCGAVYSSRYFWIEALCAALFLLLFLHYGPSLTFLVTAVFAALLIVATFTDLDEYIIPDEIAYAGLILGFLFSGVAHWGVAPGSPLTGGLIVGHPLSALGGALLGGGFLYLIGVAGRYVFRKEAMGMGDVKLLGMMGTFLGPANVVVTVFLASCIGAVFGLSQKAMAAIRHRKSYAYIPFGPYLALAGFLTYFFGRMILDRLFPPEALDLLREVYWGR